ncbi:hypothetical protein BDF20DRAFT_989304 [Mycotypha africana]|uniref:uncharacterized protein n=1 Tax=Mycotypha africana TaxID=64632 RepID=UPI0023013E87|nr:uncharacterized protein BDF20DRAFT_989304 [Mycotypha africana]KAI8973308.1 hypothetical protein BDF20DRAFT_989304 [Mycotypha africana]
MEDFLILVASTIPSIEVLTAFNPYNQDPAWLPNNAGQTYICRESYISFASVTFTVYLNTSTIPSHSQPYRRISMDTIFKSAIHICLSHKNSMQLLYPRCNARNAGPFSLKHALPIQARNLLSKQTLHSVSFSYAATVANIADSANPMGEDVTGNENGFDINSSLNIRNIQSSFLMNKQRMKSSYESTRTRTGTSDEFGCLCLFRKQAGNSSAPGKSYLLILSRTQSSFLKTSSVRKAA